MKTSILLIFICFVASVYTLPTIETEDLQSQELQQGSIDYKDNLQLRLTMKAVPCSTGRTRALWGKCISCARYYNFFQKEGEGCPPY
ncbi:unnamed protein product [Pieris brassicae]|uniref:Uncharacterized protein n=1 Tax=Pieris brassicae TaxID=7116 RepID=A0A9P0XAZ9_PIEBR|nr:unnamed protein product [Pieris brassicae]